VRGVVVAALLGKVDRVLIATTMLGAGRLHGQEFIND
jgi:hypothetical protein